MKISFTFFVYTAESRTLKKSAFTLAEVLITLGIIGVVAAMTLPVLTQKYQKMVLKNQYKKVYSALSQAYSKAVFDIGGDTGCVHVYEGKQNSTNTASECKAFGNELRKSLKFIKVCQGNALAGKCIPPASYKSYSEVYKEFHPDMSEDEVGQLESDCPYNKSQINNRNTVYVFNDGTIIIDSRGDRNDYAPYAFLVDVNGQKGPNKWGYDLFKLSFVKEKNKQYRLMPAGCDVTEKGGTTSADMLKNMHI